MATTKVTDFEVTPIEEAHSLMSLALALDEYMEDSVPRSLMTIATHLKVSQTRCARVIHVHRNELDSEKWALVHILQEGEHRYMLTSEPNEIATWCERRIRAIATQAQTVQRMVNRSVRKTKPTTVAGMRSREIFKSISRIAEDSTDLAVFIEA